MPRLTSLLSLRYSFRRTTEGLLYATAIPTQPRARTIHGGRRRGKGERPTGASGATTTLSTSRKTAIPYPSSRPTVGQAVDVDDRELDQKLSSIERLLQPASELAGGCRGQSALPEARIEVGPRRSDDLSAGNPVHRSWSLASEAVKPVACECRHRLPLRLGVNPDVEHRAVRRHSSWLLNRTGEVSVPPSPGPIQSGRPRR